MAWSDVQRALKKTWHFLWSEDSVWSWLANIAIAFVLIKFLIYPGIGLLLGTQLPVVAVISESMEHPGSFDDWWNSKALCGEGNAFLNNFKDCTQHEWYAEKGITYDDFKSYPFSNGFNKGDIMVLKGTSYEDVEMGDVIVYNSKLTYPIIHRVVEKNDVIQTKGDHNVRQIADTKLNERYVTKDSIEGKAWFRIPWLGYIKIWFVGTINCVASGFKVCTF